MKIYLDIDDTLLNTEIFNRRAANHLKPFLEDMLEKYEVYWLTSHCNGDPSVPVAYLSRFVTPDITPLLMKIKPTKWEVLKTEAINMDEEFLWFDDSLSWGEEEALKAKNKLSSHVKIDIYENPDVLLDFTKKQHGSVAIKHTTLNWKISSSGDFWTYSLDIAIHPYNNGKILINYPGAGGDIDGYNEKYIKLSNYIVEKGLAAVVRSGNQYAFGWDMNLRHVLAYCLSHSKEICGTNNPEIFLMGFSAGAGAIGMIAWEYPEVTKILLMAPAIGVGEDEVKQCLSKFKGQVYIVIGDKDEVVGPDAGKLFLDLSSSASYRELFIIPNCDHQFKGETNGRIMSEAPFYAFSQESKPLFPDPSGGIVLYQK